MKRSTLITISAAVLVVGGLAAAYTLRSKAATTVATAKPDPTKPAVAELASTDLITLASIELAQGLSITGSLKAVNTALVKARVSGELQALSVREGDFVRAGQLIARVDSSDFAARVKQAVDQADAAQAQVDIAQRQFDNNKALVNQGFISKTALDTSSASLASARATHRAALSAVDVAKKSVEDTLLRAPIAGVISQRLAQPGERVNIDARIVEIVDLSRLELEAAIPTTDAAVVRVGQTAVLQIEGMAQTVQASVVRINPSAQANSRSVLAYLSVRTTDGLRQGLFAQGTLGTSRERALALPLSAVRTDKPQPYVQVLVDNTIRHATVQLGSRGEANGDAVVAVSGLAAGAQVLAGSLGAVREGTQVKITAQVAAAPIVAASAAKTAASAP